MSSLDDGLPESAQSAQEAKPLLDARDLFAAK